jgi:hypothetical protein
VFTDRAFLKGEFITFYDGERIDRAKALQLLVEGKHSHIKTIHRQGTCINGLQGDYIVAGSGLGSMINDKRSAGSANVEFVEADVELEVYIKASVAIPAGAELFVDYGRDYWKRMQEETTE